MATSSRVTVYTTTTEVASGRGSYAFRNGGTVACYLGALDVTTSNGYTLTPGSQLFRTLGAGERLWGVTASDSTTIEVMT